MTAADPHHAWDDAYAGPAPAWDIGRPQPAFVTLADRGRLTGSVLDAGCGTGEHTILAAQHGATALGVDVSRRAVEMARAKAAERSVDCRFEVGDALALDGRADRFDTVIDCGLFHVFDDSSRPRYVASLHRVLRPDGHLHLMCFSDRQPGDWGPRRIAEADLRSAFATGWRFVSLTADRFRINPGVGTDFAEAWRADLVRMPDR